MSSKIKIVHVSNCYLEKFSAEKEAPLDSTIHLMHLNFVGAKNGEQDCRCGTEHWPGEHIAK